MVAADQEMLHGARVTEFEPDADRDREDVGDSDSVNVPECVGDVVFDPYAARFLDAASARCTSRSATNSISTPRRSGDGRSSAKGMAFERVLAVVFSGGGRLRRELKRNEWNKWLETKNGEHAWNGLHLLEGGLSRFHVPAEVPRRPELIQEREGWSGVRTQVVVC